MENLTIGKLKEILNNLPDDLPIIMPVISEENANDIYGFRYIRTAGVLCDQGEKDDHVLCLNAAADGYDLVDQIHFSGKGVSVESVLFGKSKFDSKSEESK